MTTLNSYASLNEFKAWKSIGSTDAADDAVIDSILKAASRFIDSRTTRHFIPYVETRYFDIPDDLDYGLLLVDDDLLEVISLVNGDGTTIPSAQYSLEPRNISPRYGVRLKGSSTYTWLPDGAESDGVIAVTGVWGYHERYTEAWLLGSTANEAMDASETGYTVTDGSAFAAGQLIRFDNELGYVSAVVTNDLTTMRGENYSTATEHLTGINVYIWQVQADIKEACLLIANSDYQKRSGQNIGGIAQVTAAGVVISPEGIPQRAWDTLKAYERVV